MLERLTQSVDQPWMVWSVCWFISLVLIVAAWIDGRKLKVPNWLTFPLILSGWAVSGYLFGWSGLYSSLLGTAVGLGLLLPAYAIGGMGAGDVKLLAGVGAWIGMAHTFWAFVLTVVIGAILAVAMVAARGAWGKHIRQFFAILFEILIVRNPEKLAALAAERKPKMLLLPYGIPIAIGTIVYFLVNGMLFPV
jgi:prepilin peptidase CpaA